jgi:hypothetical protein
MNRVEIAYLLGWPKPPKDSELLDRVESVVKRAILAEREACARICRDLGQGHGVAFAEFDCVEAIRARGQE